MVVMQRGPGGFAVVRQLGPGGMWLLGNVDLEVCGC